MTVELKTLCEDWRARARTHREDSVRSAAIADALDAAVRELEERIKKTPLITAMREYGPQTGAAYKTGDEPWNQKTRAP